MFACSHLQAITEQNRAFNLEEDKAKIRSLKDTVQSQEGVIARLEGLLAAAAKDRHRRADAAGGAAHSALQTTTELQSTKLQLEIAQREAELARREAAAEVEGLRREVAEQRAAREELKAALRARHDAGHDDLRAQLASVLEDRGRLESEKLTASMRAAQAEVRAQALNHELFELTRRYARELAALKTKLAEKEAALQGGFGPMAGLAGLQLSPGPGAGPAGVVVASPAAAAMEGSGEAPPASQAPRASLSGNPGAGPPPGMPMAPIPRQSLGPPPLMQGAPPGMQGGRGGPPGAPGPGNPPMGGGGGRGMPPGGPGRGPLPLGPGPGPGMPMPGRSPMPGRGPPGVGPGPGMPMPGRGPPVPPR